MTNEQVQPPKVLNVNGVDHPFDTLSEKVKILTNILGKWEEDLKQATQAHLDATLEVQKNEAAIAHISNLILTTLQEELEVEKEKEVQQDFVNGKIQAEADGSNKPSTAEQRAAVHRHSTPS